MRLDSDQSLSTLINILMEKAKQKLERKTLQLFKGTLSKLSNTYLLAH